MWRCRSKYKREILSSCSQEGVEKLKCSRLGCWKVLPPPRHKSMRANRLTSRFTGNWGRFKRGNGRLCSMGTQAPIQPRAPCTAMRRLSRSRALLEARQDGGAQEHHTRGSCMHARGAGTPHHVQSTITPSMPRWSIPTDLEVNNSLSHNRPASNKHEANPRLYMHQTTKTTSSAHVSVITNPTHRARHQPEPPLPRLGPELNPSHQRQCSSQTGPLFVF